MFIAYKGKAKDYNYKVLIDNCTQEVTRSQARQNMFLIAEMSASLAGNTFREYPFSVQVENN